MKVFILTEGGKEIGFGHVTRCIALYQALREKNFESVLIINGDNSVKDLLKNVNYLIFNWFANRKRIFEILANADIVIIDSYLADLEFYRKVSDIVKIPIYFDDNKRLNYPKGIIINGNVYALELNYPKRKENIYLLGPRYLCLREEFRKAPRNNIREHVNDVLLTFGGSKYSAFKKEILKFLLKTFPGFNYHFVINKGIKSLLSDENNKIKFYRSISGIRLLRLMLKTDIAISAGGQTLYELARVGLPTIGVCFADNQKKNLQALHKAGFLTNVGSFNKKAILDCLCMAIKTYFSKKRRLNMSLTGRCLIDCKGSQRIAKSLETMIQNIESEKLILRPVIRQDSYDLWKWRNHPDVRRWCFATKEIPFGDHKQWFDKKFKDINTRIYIAENEKKEKLGQVRFEINEKAVYINVNLNPRFIGKGIGSKIIQNSTRCFLDKTPNIKRIIAEVLVDNIASKRAFKKAGYRLLSRPCYRDGKKILKLIYENVNKN